MKLWKVSKVKNESKYLQLSAIKEVDKISKIIETFKINNVLPGKENIPLAF